MVPLRLTPSLSARLMLGGIIHYSVSAPDCSGAPAAYPGVVTDRISPAPCVALLPVGFAEPAGHPTAGGLLPRHFTLTAAEQITLLTRLTYQPSGLPGVFRELALRETISWGR
jgi:hypothetical protein